MKLEHTKYSKFVSKNGNGRQVVISDIHGCLDTFEALLNQIKLTENDQLFLLGDYINKGKNSKDVLDLVIKLQQNQYKKGFQLFPLRGCVYNKKWYLGNLVCLDLNSFEVFIQENIEN